MTPQNVITNMINTRSPEVGRLPPRYIGFNLLRLRGSIPAFAVQIDQFAQRRNFDRHSSFAQERRI
jgi:hypothetical protein